MYVRLDKETYNKNKSLAIPLGKLLNMFENKLSNELPELLFVDAETTKSYKDHYLEFTTKESHVYSMKPFIVHTWCNTQLKISYREEDAYDASDYQNMTLELKDYLNSWYVVRGV
jgi:hypothetical protein